MKNLLITIAVFLSLTQLAFAKEWNGIKPLQTSRAEVIKLLGNPLPRDQKIFHVGERFESEGQSIYIRWTSSDCREEMIFDDAPPIGLNVLAHQITVAPRSPLALLNIEKLDLPQKSSTLPGFSAWGSTNCLGSGGKWSCIRLNIEAGFGYTTATDKTVVWLYYFPSEREELEWKEKVPLCSIEKK